MKKLSSLWALVACFVAIAQSALAQEMCQTIAQYFVGVPQGFVAERGQRLRSGTWKSNRSPDCTIYERQSGSSHRIVCYFNRYVQGEDARDFLKANEEAVDDCVSKLPTANEYQKDVKTTTEGGDTTVRSSWTADIEEQEKTTTFRISVSATLRADGRAYNTMQLSYDEY